MLEQRLIENLTEFEEKIESLRKDAYKNLKKYRKERNREGVSYFREYIHSLEGLTRRLCFYLNKSFSEHKIDETIDLNPPNWMN